MLGLRRPERAEADPVENQRTSTKMKLLMMLALIGGAYMAAIGEGIDMVRKGVKKIRGSTDEIEERPLV